MQSTTTTNTTTTETVKGKRLQTICRKLGLNYEEAGYWQKNPSRHYPDKWKVTGVSLAKDDAAKLRAYLAEREAKAQARRAKLADPAYLKAKAEARAKREARELDKITRCVNARWTLPADEVRAFAEHANATGSGRVLRTTTACYETFETKVYMALVAWLRHNKTSYESDLRSANDAAWAHANSLLPDFLAGERWSDYPHSQWAEFAEAREEARLQCDENRDRLHAAKTDEAVQWLAARETALGKEERLARESKKAAQVSQPAPLNSSDESVSPSADGGQPMTAAGCSLAVAM